MAFRIGLIVPSSNTTMEPDFYGNAPPDTAVYTARMFLEEVTVSAEEEMLDTHFPVALRDITTVHPDVVVFGCTSAGALRGNDYDAELVRRIEREAGCPGVSVVQSVQAALRRHGRRVLVLTPYMDEVTERVAAALEDDGFDIAAAYGMGIRANADIGRVSPDEIIRFARDKAAGAAARADCLFLSCTNLQAMAARHEIEQQLGLPVETSNHATFQAVMAVMRAASSDEVDSKGADASA